MEALADSQVVGFVKAKAVQVLSLERVGAYSTYCWTPVIGHWLLDVSILRLLSDLNSEARQRIAVSTSDRLVAAVLPRYRQLLDHPCGIVPRCVMDLPRME